MGQRYRISSRYHRSALSIDFKTKFSCEFTTSKNKSKQNPRESKIRYVDTFDIEMTKYKINLD